MDRHLLKVALLCVVLSVGCKPDNAYKPPPPPPVLVAKPSQRPVQSYLYATGTTKATETVEIRARVQGFLEKIHFEAGTDVEANQVLFTIEKKPLEAVKQQAEAAVSVAKAEDQDATAKYKRAEPLLATGAVSAEELNEKKAAMIVTNSKISAAEAQLVQAKLDLSYTDVKSPIAGRVSKHLVDEGNLVGSTDQTHLATVVKYDPIYANFSIAETEIQRILRNSPPRKEGSNKVESVTVEMSLSDEVNEYGQRDYPHKGELEYVDLGVQRETGTLTMRGIFKNLKNARGHYLIMDGSFVSIRIPKGPPKPSILVPESAVGFDQAGRFVLVVVEKDVDGERQSIVERRDIAIGELDGADRVVESGLKADEWVIIEGVQRARPGLPVSVTQQDAKSSSGTPTTQAPDTESTSKEPGSNNKGTANRKSEAGKK